MPTITARPPRRQRRVGGLDRGGAPERLEGDVRTAARRTLDRPPIVVGPGQHGVGRTEARASSSAASVTSTATIGCAPAARRPWTMHWPTPPHPKTTARSPGRTAAVLKTAPTPVMAAQPISAATSRSAPSGSSTACVAGTTTCSAKQAVAMKWPRSCPRALQAGAAVRHAVEVRADLAERRRAGGARAAAAARCHPGERDRVADARRQHARPDGLDDPGALVAEHHRQVVLPGAIHDVEVGAADAGGGDAHPHLARPRLAELDLLDAQRSTGLPQDCCLRAHGGSIGSSRDVALRRR